jgi:hypothetical protein
MKTRSGFVSNSSSSSFLVLLNEIPKSLPHLRELIFSVGVWDREDIETPEIQEFAFSPYRDKEKDPEDAELGRDKIFTVQIASYLGLPDEFVQIGEQSRRELLSFVKRALRSGTPTDLLLTWDRPPYPMYIRDEPEEQEKARWIIWEAETRKWIARHAKEIVDGLIAQHNGKCLCIFEASDNGAGWVGIIAEHGDVFTHTPFHLRFSRH